MEEAIASFRDSFQTWGYLILFVYCMGSGYVGIVAAGILSSLGSMDLGVSVIVAFAGNTVGSSILAVLGKYQKREIMHYFAKHRRKAALAQIWLKRYGVWLIFFNKYVYGVKTIVPLAIGLSKYDMKKFLILNALSCLIWASLIGFAAFFAGGLVAKTFGKMMEMPWLPALVFVAGALGIWTLLKKFAAK